MKYCKAKRFDPHVPIVSTPLLVIGETWPDFRDGKLGDSCFSYVRLNYKEDTENLSEYKCKIF